MKRNFLSRTDCLFSLNALKMINFCKNSSCPTSEVLLAFQKGEICREDTEVVRQHLTGCEFCATEVEFYARFPQSEDACIETKIPLPLYQLAEALLSNNHRRFSLLNKLLSENGSLTLEKA